MFKFAKFKLQGWACGDHAALPAVLVRPPVEDLRSAECGRTSRAHGPAGRGHRGHRGLGFRRLEPAPARPARGRWAPGTWPQQPGGPWDVEAPQARDVVLRNPQVLWAT